MKMQEQTLVDCIDAILMREQKSIQMKGNVIMNVKIVFSPTGGTAKVADILTKNWNGVECIDLTKADKDFSECQFNSDDRALIAMPSYGGLAPEVAN